MKTFQKILAIVASLAIIVVLLISAFEIAAYSDFGWYENAYEKHGVLDDLEMEMEDVLDVTKEMMEYLRGNRKNLVVHTVIDGQEREFFNDREKAHMVDVKELFIGGLWIRRIGVLVLVLSVATLLRTKADWKILLPKSFLSSFAVIAGITVGAGLLFVFNFNKYFTIFHKIFFDNDLWLLDPDTDLLIRMLPEGFFLDMVIRIGVIFLSMSAVGIIISTVVLYWNKHKNN